jgi:uncharacterized membrane protein
MKRIRDGRVAVLKASGKAVDKALQIGLYFLDAGEVVVVATGTVEVVDDIAEKERVGMKRKRKAEKAEEEEDEDTSMRVRKMSTVEITITLSKKS